MPSAPTAKTKPKTAAGSASKRSKPSTSSASNKRTMSDDAVRAKTGKTWPQWFSLLDKAGAKNMNHRDIVALIASKHKLSPWWQQMVTVGYELARGLRRKHERPDGYSISRSLTLKVPVTKLYAFWDNPNLRAKWLPHDGITIRTAEPAKSMRFIWEDGTTAVEANFQAKGSQKSQITVQHNKLPSAAAGERMKKSWGQYLERLADLLHA
jgi:uncharacterized protein YndB with AHSA1/START domain